MATSSPLPSPLKKPRLSTSCPLTAPPEHIRRVLSIQSHVVHGYVGNRAAVFPLQLLGFEVDVINSVQFSCHTGYPKIAGNKLNGDDLRTLVDGLETNGVLQHQHLITGYIGTASFLREVIRLRQRLPPSCRYICDPVMGDNGKLYVAEECVDVYREEVVPHVTVLTPNQFEAELLTKLKISDLASAAAVCDALHERGPQTVVITTLDVDDATCGGKFIGMMLSEVGRHKWMLRVPYIPGGPFTGTGDLTASMLLAWTQFHPHEMVLALEKSGAVLQSVLRRTVQTDCAFEVGGKRVPPELRIIESKRAIETPTVGMRCHLVNPRKFQGVVFDMDGTLTLPFQLNIARLRERLSIENGVDVVTYLRKKHAGDEKALADAMKIVEEEEAKAFSPPALQPGVKDCISYLVARGVSVAILTRNCQASVTSFLQHAGLPSDSFHPVITRDAPMQNKPSPEAILHCCKVWGVEPASVLVVGDGLDDMKAGTAAGCSTVSMLRPSTDDLDEAAKVALKEAPIVEASEFHISDLKALERFFPLRHEK
eukprot:TRINITY_DN18552_c0_g1_i1.p1 TRINITY_DN18552_c0_g1~~TRINITY_DN18552_c0_g1_i1.p1  ORF type:complete len:540 (-),score=95.05 TRINITY_DN18552_c0_g1_i1:128-1747(-)